MVDYKHDKVCPGYYVRGEVSYSGHVIYGVCTKCGMRVERYEKYPLVNFNLKQDDE